MNSSASPSTPPPGCKENPFHKTGTSCRRNHECPYRLKPPQLHAHDFASTESVAFEDNFCDVCQSQVVNCPPPPPPKKEPEKPKIEEPVRTAPPRWRRWIVPSLASLLVLGGALWAVNQCSEEVTTTVVKPPVPTPTSTTGTSPTGATTATPTNDSRTKRGGSGGGAKNHVEPPPHPDGLFVEVDPGDGKCKRFLYENGKKVGSEILDDPSECNK